MNNKAIKQQNKINTTFGFQKKVSLPSTIFSFDKTKNSAGFTLIETFIAITILLITITGPLYLVTKGLSVSKVAKGQITAMYLAQEAVEYIRNVRDGNILNGDDWLTGLNDCISGKCKIDSPDEEISSCGSVCENLKYNSTNYLYGYRTGEPSLFKREVEITQISSNKEAEIIVGIFWNNGPNEYEFEVKERLLNWQ